MNNINWFQRLKNIECPDATMEAPNPIVLSRGQGSLVWDIESKPYIDLCAGFGSLALGHSHPRLQQVLQKTELFQGMGDVYPTEAKITALETIKQHLPDYLSHGAFAITGGQAVELAIKTASLATGGSGVICFDQGYHGLDLGVLPLAGREDFKEPFQSLFKQENVERVAYGAPMEELEQALNNFKRKKIIPSSVIVEPILGRGGVIIPPEGWLAELANFCQKQDILLIYDEIMTGMGRTGSFTHAESVPCDILCLGKALGGGFPISACFSTQKIMDAWKQGQKEALHTGTFFGHPLMCEMVTETIREIEDKNLIKQACETGQYLKSEIQKKLKDFPEFKEVRVKGLMCGLEFKSPSYGVKLMNDLIPEGVIVLPCGPDGRSLSIIPAFNIERELLDQALEKIVKVMTK